MYRTPQAEIEAGQPDVVRFFPQELRLLREYERSGATLKQLGGVLRKTPETIKRQFQNIRGPLGLASGPELIIWLHKHPGVLESGEAYLGIHPVGCGCGYRYCTEKTA